MSKYLIKRLLHAMLTLLGIATIVFFLQHITGDPAMVLLPPELSTVEELETLRTNLGLDKPLIIQYKIFILRLLKGDLGYSYRQSTPALPLVIARVPATFKLALAGMLVAILIGVASGVVASIKRNTIIDRLVMSFALLGQAMPVYWTGILLIIIFSIRLKWLPVLSDGGFKSLIMPAIALGGFTAARIARITRSSMLEVLGMDFVRTAKGKGLKKKEVILKHAFRNALIPIVTVLGMEFGSLMGGSVIAETVFAWPGVGRLAIEAILGRDYPIVQAVVLVVCTIFILINLGVDLIYGYLDPRINVINVSK